MQSTRKSFIANAIFTALIPVYAVIFYRCLKITPGAAIWPLIFILSTIFLLVRGKFVKKKSPGGLWGIAVKNADIVFLCMLLTCAVSPTYEELGKTAFPQSASVTEGSEDRSTLSYMQSEAGDFMRNLFLPDAY